MREGHLYVVEQGDTTSHLRRFDLGDPLRPVEVHALPIEGPCGTLALAGDVAAVGCSHRGIQLFDLRAGGPRAAALIPMSRTSLFDLAAAGDTIFAGTYPDTPLLAYNVSDPDSPEKIDQADLPSLGKGLAAGDDLVLAAGRRDEGLNVVRHEAGSLGTIANVATPAEVIDGTIVGDHAYVTHFQKSSEGRAFLSVIDLSDPSSPRWVGALPAMDRPQHLAVDGNVAYVAASLPRRLYTVDLSDPERPVLLGRADAEFEGLWRIAVDDGHAFVADQRSGLLVFDASDPSNLQEVGRLGLGTDQALNVQVSEGFAYVSTSAETGSTGQGQLYIIDVRDPAAPRVTSSINLCDKCWHVAVAGDTVYVSGEDSVRIVDVSDRSAPKEVGSIDEAHGRKAWVDGTTLIVKRGGEVGLYDITQPATPIERAVIPLPLTTWTVSVGPERVYVTTRGRKHAEAGGVQVYDTSDPSAPHLLGYIETPGEAETVAGLRLGSRAETSADEYALVADNAGGLVVVRVGPADPAAER